MTSSVGQPGLLVPALRRWWRVVVATTAMIGLPATLALDAVDPRSFQMTRTYLVSSLATTDDDPALVSANTDRAARSYAAVLRRDDRLLDALSRRTGRSPEAVSARLVVGYERASSAIRVRYQGGSAPEVQAVFDELDRVAATIGLPTGGLPAAGLQPLQSSRDVLARIDPVRSHPAWGLLLGLLAGLIAATLLERSRPRVVDRGHLQALTRRPVLEVGADEARADVLTIGLLEHGANRVALLAAPGAVSVDLASKIRTAFGRLAAAGVLYDDPVSVGPATESDLTRASTAWLAPVVVGERVSSVMRRLELLPGHHHAVVALCPAEVTARGAA